VLLGLALAFVTLHLALRGISGLFSIPQQARRWRLSYKERTIYSGLLDTISHLVAGRFVRARKAAEVVVAVEDAMLTSGDALPDAARLRTLAHLLAAGECACIARPWHARNPFSAGVGGSGQQGCAATCAMVFSCVPPAGPSKTGIPPEQSNGWSNCPWVPPAARLPCDCVSRQRVRPAIRGWRWTQPVY